MNNKLQRGKVGYIAEDLIMMVLLVINLLFISFDWLFQSGIFRDFVNMVWPAFHDFYALHIHPDFVFYDLIFIAIFLTEFVLRWIASVIRSDYQKWYFFPFIHWYDLVGCIPIGAFRFLRLLRVISIALRLHRLGWIDLTTMPIFSFVVHYFNLFVQEVTDRVSLKILSNIRDELQGGTPVIDNIVNEVIRPRQHDLTDWISGRLRIAASKGYEMHEQQIRDYVKHRINQAVEKNRELKNLENIPVMGSYIVNQIERAVSDIVFNVVHGLIEDLASDKNKVFVEDVSSVLLAEDDQEDSEYIRNLNYQLSSVLSESIEIIMKKIENKNPDEFEQQAGRDRIQQRIREEFE